MRVSLGHRGLTLIEVLVATAILALIAGAAIPLLQRVASTLRHTAPAQTDMNDLARLADEVIGTPGLFGISAGAALPTSVSWPEEPSRSPATLEFPGVMDSSLDARAQLSGGAWVVFRDGERFVVRWLDVPVKVIP